MQIIASERHVSSISRLPIVCAAVFTGILRYRAQRATGSMLRPAGVLCAVCCASSENC